MESFRLPREIKLAENIQTFKRAIKQWDGPTVGAMFATIAET